MGAPGWLSRQLADVPPGVSWLSDGERSVLAALALQPRRTSWRLGRWTAKAAVSQWLELAPARIEIRAAADGAPEAWRGREQLPVSISISHRGHRAVAVVADAPAVIGCDLELIEPRSGAFVREWLAPSEQALVGSAAPSERPLIANLLWTGKEAAAKVRREGLRLNVRRTVVDPFLTGAQPGRWSALRVEWEIGQATLGWWRSDLCWVMSLAGECAPRRPVRLDGPGASP